MNEYTRVLSRRERTTHGFACLKQHVMKYSKNHSINQLINQIDS